MQRAMALAFPEERATWAFEDQFMFGEKVLVAPCLQAGGDVEFYLPSGNWLQFPSGDVFTGGQSYKLTLNLDEMAVFVRENETIPLGPTVQNTDELDGPGVIEEYWPTNQLP